MIQLKKTDLKTINELKTKSNLQQIQHTDIPPISHLTRNEINGLFDSNTKFYKHKSKEIYFINTEHGAHCIRGIVNPKDGSKTYKHSFHDKITPNAIDTGGFNNLGDTLKSVIKEHQTTKLNNVKLPNLL